MLLGLRNILLILTILIIGSSCLLEPGTNTRSKKTGSEETTAPDVSKETTPPTFTDLIKWYTSGAYHTSIIAPESTKSVVYVRGSSIHEFLDVKDVNDTRYNYEKNYCIVMDFNQAGGTKQYRVRANAITNISNDGNSTERMFRIDLPDGNGGSDICVGEITSSNRLPTSNPNKVFVGSNGVIYVASDEGLYISSNGGNTFSKKTNSHGLPSNSVLGVYADSSGNVYAATSSGLAFSYNGGAAFTKTVTSSTTGFASTYVTDVATNSTGTVIYAATDSGISVSIDSGVTYSIKTTAHGLGNNYVNSLFTTGSTVYASTNGGLSITTDNGTSFMNKSYLNGLGSSTVYRSFANGTRVYAATANGLSVSTNSGSTFSNRTTAHGLASNVVYGVAATSSGMVYGATANGLSISKDFGASFTETKTSTSGISSNFCKDVTTDSNGHLYIATTGGVSITTSEAAYTLEEVCESCSGVIDSTNLSIYEVSNNQISDTLLIDQGLIPIKNLIFRVNTSTNSVEPPGGGCDDMYCIHRGYNCCVDGQCAFDGAKRPEASSLPADVLAQAAADLITNPKNFVNWPNIYYVCGNVFRPTPTPTPTVDAEATADAYFEAEKERFLCLEGGEQETPDYTHCCEAKDSSCTVDDYLAIRMLVLEECGCEAIGESAPYDPATVCPEFGLKVTRDISDNITKVDCKVPPIDPNPTPFQSLLISVSSRSAPHRFYRKDNGEYVDDMSEIAGTDVEQEGEKFEYMDRASKLDPITPSFSMNAVLGSMTNDFVNAVPAKMVEVTYDETYIISATSGFYTPCMNCIQDSWFSAFSSAPKTEGGDGLMSVGHTTTRDSFITNTSKGNYEDTIFGRACWIPATMIPFTHSGASTTQTQRMNRLKTQASLYINGYQRDWFGFNRGALIGSFDGVKWFAIGSGRRVTAKTTKLYLAINGPFADVAENSPISVSVVLDNGFNTASSFDYDFGIAYNRPDQNKAGSCQRHHVCDTDYDCVSKLGWEYMCSDVSPFRTLWPHFDTDGNESSNQEVPIGFFELSQYFNSDGGFKRCVYRGSGSLCVQDYSSLTNISSSAKKMFTCAPNFHCSALDQNYNSTINRSINAVEAIQFGQQTPILGRPTSYIGGDSTLPGEVTTNLQDNIANIGSILTGIDNSNFGICRPGRSVTSTNPITQHRTQDSGHIRTDYISQIAPCDARAPITSVGGVYNGDARIRSCPRFITDKDSSDFGNYVIETTDFTESDYDEIHMQNMCGMESRVDLDDYPFSDIEALPLSQVSELTTKSIVRDACVRKAGSICHTNLDCSPNRLHATQADLYDNNQFGNNDAERDFWMESLVCSQVNPVPALGDDLYADYDMSKNRCCRAAGEKLTMYTGLGGFDTSEDDEFGDNDNLRPSFFPQDNPARDNRYSRYASVTSILTPYTTAAANNPDPYFAEPYVEKITGGAGTATAPHPFQWKTIHDTGKNTCCGGGWIRNFATGDNNHDWTEKPSPKFVWSDFKCLNYSNELLFEIPESMTAAGGYPATAATAYESRYGQEQSRLCRHPADKIQPANGGNYSSTNSNWTTVAPENPVSAKVWMEGGCIQNPVTFPREYEIKNPTTPRITTRILDTTPTDVPGETQPPRSLHRNAPYMPIIYPNPNQTVDSDAKMYGKYINFFWTARNNPLTMVSGVSFYLPIYIDPRTITNMYGRYFDEDGEWLYDQPIPRSHPTYYCNTGAAANHVLGIGSAGMGQNTCRFTNDLTIMHVKGDFDYEYDHDDDSDTDDIAWKYGGIVIYYEPFGTEGYIGGAAGQRSEGRNPGNAMYYSTKLARFELLGIPQIFYEPLVCNSNPEKIVDNIFDIGSDDWSDFESNSTSVRYTRKGLGQIYEPTNGNLAIGTDPTNPENRVVYQDKVGFSSVWKGHSFSCCIKLGEETTDKTLCCSGYSEDSSLKKDSNNQAVKVCMLPQKTDLSLYFNRFISSEGGDPDGPGGGLDDDDFVPETGEPKLTTAVKNKLVKLGEEYCAGGKAATGSLSDIKTGGLIGKFYGQPNSGSFPEPKGDDADEEDLRIESVMDSTQDQDDDHETGNKYYNEGFYWNHHFYCPGSS